MRHPSPEDVLLGAVTACVRELMDDTYQESLPIRSWAGAPPVPAMEAAVAVESKNSGLSGKRILRKRQESEGPVDVVRNQKPLRQLRFKKDKQDSK